MAAKGGGKARGGTTKRKAKATKAKRKPGRPSIRTAGFEQALLAHVAAGQTLRSFCRQEGKPAARTVYDWLDGDLDFSARFAKCRHRGFDQIAEQALELVDAEPERVDGKIDPGHVQWTRSRVWTRLQLLAKWDPRRYGNKVEVAGDRYAPLFVEHRMDDHERARQLAVILAQAAARSKATKNGATKSPPEPVPEPEEPDPLLEVAREHRARQRGGTSRTRRQRGAR